MTPLEEAGAELAAARARLAEAMTAAEHAADNAAANGVTEVEIARTLGVNRLTVRKWFGKL